MKSPEQVLREQADRVRARWRDPAQRDHARVRLAARDPLDPTRRVWAAILAGEHPFAAWLDGSDAFDTLGTAFADGPSPRQIVSSHPFVAGSPWSSPTTSRAS